MIMVKMLLQELRWKKDWTQLQLSIQADISEAYVCQIENGKKIPSLEVLCRIAIALGVPITDLFVYTNGIQSSVKH